MHIGNLGWYQIITTISKPLGGPQNLLLLVGGAGCAVGIAVEHSPVGKGIAKAKNAALEILHKKKHVGREDVAENTYTVTACCECGGGLTLSPGDRFRVLGTNPGIALIEVLGNASNPYYVSSELLKDNSDYEE